MIGNDVIDIAAARCESNIRRKGWQEKLFAIVERAFISASDDPEQSVWLLWSMKEAAYKAWNRETGIRVFNPQKLICDITVVSGALIAGRVCIDDTIYYTQSSISGGIVYTVAAKTEGLLNCIHRVPVSSVQKDAGALPFFRVGSVNFAASKSHHGNTTMAVALINI